MSIMALTIIFITLLLSPVPINSFNPHPTGSVSPIFTSTRLFGSPLSNEKIIREEINEKNSLVDAEDEIKYGSTVGQGIEFNKTLVIDAGKGSTYPSEVLQKIEKVTKGAWVCILKTIHYIQIYTFKRYHHSLAYFHGYCYLYIIIANSRFVFPF